MIHPCRFNKLNPIADGEDAIILAPLPPGSVTTLSLDGSDPEVYEHDGESAALTFTEVGRCEIKIFHPDYTAVTYTAIIRPSERAQELAEAKVE